MTQRIKLQSRKKIVFTQNMETHGYNVNLANVIRHLRCLLANVIVHCMENKLDRTLIENCNKWAVGRLLGMYGVWSPLSNGVNKYGPLVRLQL